MLEASIGFAVLLALIMLQVPVAFAMTLVGLAGTAFLRSWPSAYSMDGSVV